MADRFWVGNGGNWSDNTNHWAAVSDGAPGASLPTSADDVYFDDKSITLGAQTVTVDVSVDCLSMDWTGCLNNPTFAGTKALDVYGSLTFIAGMTQTYSYTITFKANTLGKTITTGGPLACNLTFYYSGGWTLQDTVDLGPTKALYIHRGTLDTNGQVVTCKYFSLSFNYTKTLTLGASIINCFHWIVQYPDKVTLNAGTSSIRLTGSFQGGSKTYNDVQITTSSSYVLQGANTFATLTIMCAAGKAYKQMIDPDQVITGTLTLAGNSVINRLLVSSRTPGTAATLTAAVVVVSNADFVDITGAGAGDWDISACAGLSGDCGGNTDIIFTDPAAQYWHLDTGSWSDPNKWFLATDGGGGAGRVPLPQDDVHIDANSIDTGGQTITVDMPRIGGSVDFTGVLNNPTVTLTMTTYICGPLALVSGLTYTHNNNYHYFWGRDSYTLTSGGKVLHGFRLDAPGGTLTIQDNLVLSSSISLYRGTLDFNNYDVTITGTSGAFQSNYEYTRGLYLRSGTITINGSSGAYPYWNIKSPNLTFDAGTSTIVLNSTAANTPIFRGADLTYNNVTIAGAGDYVWTIYGNNTFNTLTVDRSEAAKTLKILADNTQTVANFVCAMNGSVVLTITSTSTTPGILAKSGGGKIILDYLDLSYNTGSPADTWYYGKNSIIGAGVTGWLPQVVGPFPTHFVVP